MPTRRSSSSRVRRLLAHARCPIAQRGAAAAAAATRPTRATSRGATSAPKPPAAWSPSPAPIARPNEYYFGTTGGGVWKTTDGGKTAVPVTDKYFGGTIGAIAVDEKNPDVVWVGGGEYADPRQRLVRRRRVEDHRRRQDVEVHGPQGDAADLAHRARPAQLRRRVRRGARPRLGRRTPERGVFKTTDGGKTWKKILFRNDSTGAIELLMDPSNPDVLYAALWQAGRKPWLLISGGTGGGIFKIDRRRRALDGDHAQLGSAERIDRQRRA